MRNPPRMYRQGDLLFVAVEEDGIRPLKRTARTIRNGVLQRGEATGHAHRIDPRDLSKAKVYLLAGSRRIVIEAVESVRVTHEEHKPLTLPPGHWEVRRQREYSPEWRTLVLLD